MRRVAPRLLLGLAALAVAGLAVEGTWRFLRSRGWGPTTNPAYVVHDDRLGWRYRPGAKARHRTDEFDVSIRINSRGFRGPEIPLERTPGRKRIVALGDSFTFGWGVEEEEAWPAQLASILDVEVVNLGVSGYGTDQEYLLLQSDGLAYRPDLVLVQVAPNDAEEVLHDSMYGKAKPYFRLVKEGDEWPFAWKLVPRPGRIRPSMLERFSVFYRSVKRVWEARTREPLDAAASEEGWRRVDYLVEAIQGESMTAGAKFLVVADGRAPLFGHDACLVPLPEFVHAQVSSPLVRAEREEGPVRFPRDKHWNARGHRVVAETIAAALRERGFVE